MPLYEYKCKQCGHTFERLQFHNRGGVRCPECGGGVAKLMSPFSIEIPDEVCGRLPKGERRELCTECKQGGRMCPGTA
jgi:putative FmdB family regulatory protein